jgi:hypothetical protein
MTNIPAHLHLLRHRTQCPCVGALQVLRVPLEEFRSLMTSGDLLLPSVTTGFLALQRLQQMGLID